MGRGIRWRGGFLYGGWEGGFLVVFRIFRLDQGWNYIARFPIIKRLAPGIGTNVGGVMEDVVHKNGVSKLWYRMPD